MRILFANIGWMNHYRGNNATDKIVGGGSYRNDDKHEAYNFLPLNGKCYGYVQPAKWGSIKLERIEKYCSAKCLEKVLVVWIAPHPNAGGSYIVGWFKDAVVFRDFQESESAERNYYSYNIVAKANNCTLVPIDQRTFQIPRAKVKGKGFLGQSNVWYCDSPNTDVQLFRKEVIKYIDSYSGTKKHVSKQLLKVDVEAKKRVEKAAVAFVSNEYKKLGYKVESCEAQNIGWDLNAEKNGIKLKLEVKGLAGSQVSVHITMNEYNSMMANKNCYRLCVVINAIKKPYLMTFIWDESLNVWVSDSDPDMRLTIEMKPSYLAMIE